MNLEESDAFVEEMERTDKKKKNVLVTIITCGIIVVILFFLIIFLNIEDARKFKVYIDGNKIDNYSSILLSYDNVGEDIEIEKFVDNNNLNYYVNIEKMAKVLGYTYQKGEYKNYNEDDDKGYIRTPYEIVSLKADSNSFTKYILNNSTSKEDEKEKTEDNQEEQNKISIVVKSKNETQKTFYIEDTVKYINNSLYIPIYEIPQIFNVKLDVSTNNRVRIYSVDYMMNGYASRIASNYRYKAISNAYENFTAISDDMLVVSDGTNYGVVSLQTGKEIISLKYEDIVYMQNTKEFQVMAEGSVGVVSNDGKTIIKPTEYDNITVFDELKKLYLVEKDGQYGVINNSGDTIIFSEYDSIGLPNPEAYTKSEIRNYNLLFDNCIPVELEGKYGLMDLKGNEILKIAYDALGTAEIESETVDADDTDSKKTTNTTSKSSKNKNPGEGILIIPESFGIKGIIVKNNGLYGIFDAEVQHLITPCAFSKIYSETISGKTEYYLEYDGTKINLSEYLESNDLKSIEISDDKSEDDEEEIEENDNEAEEEEIEEDVEEELLEEE